MDANFSFGLMISRWQPWRHFMQKSAVTWWMHVQLMLGAYAAVSPVPDLWYICTGRNCCRHAAS